MTQDSPRRVDPGVRPVKQVKKLGSRERKPFFRKHRISE